MRTKSAGYSFKVQDFEEQGLKITYAPESGLQKHEVIKSSDDFICWGFHDHFSRDFKNSNKILYSGVENE